MQPLRDARREDGLSIVEDAVRCTAQYRGARGQPGDIACFSFYANKIHNW
jgi:dTDP-4-amino-4,6-dideoxygalactose transaminase